MFYIGNFNYNDEHDAADNYCLMPAIVEASDADEALDKFQTMFERIHARTDLLDGARKIYLDSLVELDHVPAQAVLLQWQKIVPSVDGLCSITSALPELEEGSDAAAYGWTNDESEHDHLHEDEGDFDEDVNEEGYEEEPFLTL